jgi:nucleotide-binding universal stress UspA family protein
MTKQINVVYKGSAASSEAVLWAAAEASRRGVRLRLISCYPIPAVPGAGLGAGADYTSLPTETNNDLMEMRAAVIDLHPDLQVTTVTSSDPASSVLIDKVSTDDLVVVGATGHHHGADRWLGSTARHVVRHSPCPVVVVPEAGGWGKTDRVVVGVDGSATSRLALQWAGDEADRYGAELLVVHAWMYPYIHTFPDSSEARDLMKVDGACLLDREIEAAREEFATKVTGRLMECSPSAALFATVRHGDLLVVGSKGHGAVHAALFGSTVNTVLDRCVVPTVVVRNLD